MNNNWFVVGFSTGRYRQVKVIDGNVDFELGCSDNVILAWEAWEHPRDGCDVCLTV